MCLPLRSYFVVLGEQVEVVVVIVEGSVEIVPGLIQTRRASRRPAYVRR